jgi:hypothetical protein
MVREPSLDAGARLAPRFAMYCAGVSISRNRTSDVRKRMLIFVVALGGRQFGIQADRWWM